MANRKTLSSTILWVLGIALGLSISAAVTNASDTGDQQALVDRARMTLDGFMQDTNMTYLRRKFNESKAVLIVPAWYKAGFIVGGSGGYGVLVIRDEKTGRWGQPGFYTVGSLSFGLQIGGEAAEVIMMIRTQKGVDKLLTSSFKLGGDASISAGPVGTGAKAAVTADIISFTRSKGAYVGASFEGAVISVNDDWNKAYYGREVRPVDIFVKNDVSNPGAAVLRESLAEASAAVKK